MTSRQHSLRLRMQEACGRPVDGASLFAFRVAFGALIALSALRFLALGRVNLLLLQPTFHFPFSGFSFVRPWPSFAMHAHFVALCLLGIGVSIGFRPRLCAFGFFLGFTYAELIDKTYYLNHYYFITILAGLMVLLPLGRLRPGSQIPAWVLWVFRFQVAVVYVFAGVAKLNADWLFEAQPLRMWLSAHNEIPTFGTPAIAFVASWLAAAFDLGIVGFLLWRRTRRWAFVAVVVFHVATGLLFPIGIFPFIMVTAATLFLDPAWPRRLPFFQASSSPTQRPFPPRPATPLALALFVHGLIQLVVPMFQFSGTGPSAWTGKGFNFSWNVMVAEKSAIVRFESRIPGAALRVRLNNHLYLTPLQEDAMAQDPQMIHAFAQYLSQILASDHPGARVQIFAEAYASLNGRPPQRFVNPDVDIAAHPPSDWLLALIPK